MKFRKLRDVKDGYVTERVQEVVIEADRKGR